MSGPMRRIDLARAVHNAFVEVTGTYGRVLEEVARELEVLDGIVARQAGIIAELQKAKPDPITMIPLPADFDWRNGGQECDVLIGPCSCGATHAWATVEHRALAARSARTAFREIPVPDLDLEPGEWPRDRQQMAEVERKLREAK